MACNIKRMRKCLFSIRKIMRSAMKSEVKNSQDGTGVSVMLSSVMDEYTKEKQRSLSLDTKAAFFMTTIIGVLTFLFPKLPFKRIIDNITTDNFIFYGCLFAIILGTGLLIWAFWKMLGSYQLVSYKGINIDGLGNKENMDCDRHDAQEGLCKNYVEILRKNADVNDKKAKNIKTGIEFVFWGFIFLFSGTIVLFFTIEMYFNHG